MEAKYGKALDGGRKTGLGLRDGPCVPGCLMDQAKPGIANFAMRTKLTLRLDVCMQHGCTVTDMFMVAALSTDEQISPTTLTAAFNNPEYKSTDPQTTIVDWQAFLNGPNWPKQGDRDNNINLIHKYQAEVLKLQNEDYYVPYGTKLDYAAGLK